MRCRVVRTVYASVSIHMHGLAAHRDVCVWSPRPGDVALHPVSQGRTLLSLCSPELFFFFSSLHLSTFSQLSFPVSSVSLLHLAFFSPPLSSLSLSLSFARSADALNLFGTPLLARERSNTVPSYSFCERLCATDNEWVQVLVNPQICSKAATNDYGRDGCT